MSFSKTQICNMALGNIGSKRLITNPEDLEAEETTPQATYCNLYYNLVRDAVLREHPWNFAKKRVRSVSTTPPSPEWGYGFAHQMPADYISFQMLRDWPALLFDFQDGQILSDEETIEYIYIRNSISEGRWDALFVESMTYLLAAKLAKPIADDEKMGLDMYRIFIDRVAQAKTIDRLENPTEGLETIEGTWISSRQQGSRGSDWNTW